MILLPPNPQRAWLRSYWVALDLIAGVCVAALCWAYGTGFFWFSAVVGAVVVAGVIKPHIAVWPYRAWNKLARLYAGFAEAFVLRIAFFTVCVPAGWMGSSQVRVDRPPLEESLWLPRQSQQAVADKMLQTKVDKKDPAGGWIVRYAVWAWDSGERWRLALLPFLVMLFLLQSSEEQASVPENIYTLF